MATTSSIASCWKKLSGEDNWDDLLHPLDLNLRRYIIHYLQRAGAAGDAFNGTKASKGYALSLYPTEEYFDKVGLEKGNPYHYRVTDFIYAATGDDQAAYTAYVAVATDEGKAALGRRDILVSWRGTMTAEEWSADTNLVQTSARDLFGSDLVQVHAGFYGIYTKTTESNPYAKTSAREQARKAVQALVDKYEHEEVSITVTGHSLGAALATLNAMDIAYNGINKPTGNPLKAFMVTGFPAASPRVGNVGFKAVCDTLRHFHLLRIVNSTDPVPKVPYAPLIYTHVGQHLDIDTTKSPLLKKPHNPHVLEIYEHGVAGVQENGEFRLEEEVGFDNAVEDDGRWNFIDSAYVPDPPTA
ncbi:DAD1-like seeding establishment-related lipase [Hibiscus trionum]|uniref:Phospholipase A1 n=1 Tax=Hibiscus trionum TaxID=183268 RepID=A0A9W7MR48_HIBTR|nr:DAD1-like seeding establishment-related lipase [Hibiscus trionum]